MKSDMIIDQPELKSEIRKVTEGSLTFILWLLWSYFILPIVNLVLWFLGVRLFYIEVLSRQAYWYFLEFLRNGTWIFLITTAVILIWVLYNFVRFKRRGERRRRIKVVRNSEIAAYFKVNPKTLQAFKKRRYVKGLINEKSEAQFSDSEDTA